MSLSQLSSSDSGSTTDEEMIDAQDRLRRQGLTLRSSAPPPPATGTSDKRLRIDGATGQVKPVQRLIGLHQWGNNENLSDVVIRFGDGPDDVFHGHKVILASSSFWFRNAFVESTWTVRNAQGRWTWQKLMTMCKHEANDREIALQGDDPTALHLVLRALYLPGNKYHSAEPWLDRDAANAAEMTLSKRALFSISVWQVADKYDCPNVKHWACTYTVDYVKQSLDWAGKHANTAGMLEMTDLEGVVCAVYNVAGHRPVQEEPLRNDLLNSLMHHKTTTPYGKQGVLAAELRRVAVAVPQFGADMYVKLATAAQSSHAMAQLRIAQVLQCPDCHGVFVMPVTIPFPSPANTFEMHCVHCGKKRVWTSFCVKSPVSRGA